MIPPKDRGSTSVGLDPSAPVPRRKVWVKLWPWLVSLTILIYLFTRIPLQALQPAVLPRNRALAD